MEALQPALSLQSIKDFVERRGCVSENTYERGLSLRDCGTKGWSGSVHCIYHTDGTSQDVSKSIAKAWLLGGIVVLDERAYQCSAYISYIDEAASVPSILLTSCSCTEAGISVCVHVVAFLRHLHDETTQVSLTHEVVAIDVGSGYVWKLEKVGSSESVVLPDGEEYSFGRTSREFSSLMADQYLSRSQVLLKHDSVRNCVTITQASKVNKTRIIATHENHDEFRPYELPMSKQPIDFYGGLNLRLLVNQYVFDVQATKKPLAQESKTPKTTSKTRFASDRCRINEVGNSDFLLQTCCTDNTRVAASSTRNERADSCRPGNTKPSIDMERLSRHLECSICVDLLYKPISLRCAHKFCNACWMEWAISSLKKDEDPCCPECRDTPKIVNAFCIDTSIQGTMELMFPKECEERSKAYDAVKVAELQKELDSLVKHRSDTSGGAFALNTSFPVTPSAAGRKNDISPVICVDDGLTSAPRSARAPKRVAKKRESVAPVERKRKKKRKKGMRQQQIIDLVGIGSST